MSSCRTSIPQQQFPSRPKEFGKTNPRELHTVFSGGLDFLPARASWDPGDCCCQSTPLSSLYAVPCLTYLDLGRGQIPLRRPPTPPPPDTPTLPPTWFSGRVSSQSRAVCADLLIVCTHCACVSSFIARTVRDSPKVLYGCLWLHERYSKRASTAQRSLDIDAGSADPTSSGSGTGSGGAIVPSGNGAVASPPPKKAGAGGAGHGKVLSEPLSRTVTSVRAFSGELARLGLLITFAYMCEHHPPFSHSKKVSVLWRCRFAAVRCCGRRRYCCCRRRQWGAVTFV